MYTLHRGFLDHSFCDYIANNFKDYFDYTPRGAWNAYTIRDKSLYSEILPNFFPLVDYEFTPNWINITEYTKGIGLRHHKDSESSLTIVSEISDNYTGGRFIINKKTYIKLNKGDVLTFNGSRVFHGVEKVEEGTRLSLNIWTKPKETHLI